VAVVAPGDRGRHRRSAFCFGRDQIEQAWGWERL
jgi:hypothetical protein